MTSSEPRSTLQWGKLLVWLGLLALLGLVAAGLYRTSSGPVSQGGAPDFTLTTFDGQTYDLKDLRGQVVVVNFWASWCGPCEQEAAALENTWRAYRDKGVIFLGVDWSDTEGDARAYLEKWDITYPNGPDLRTRISQSFRIRGVPETYFIDRNGQLLPPKIGPFSSEAEIRKILDPLVPADSD